MSFSGAVPRDTGFCLVLDGAPCGHLKRTVTPTTIYQCLLNYDGDTYLYRPVNLKNGLIYYTYL